MMRKKCRLQLSPEGVETQCRIPQIVRQWIPASGVWTVTKYSKNNVYSQSVPYISVMISIRGLVFRVLCGVIRCNSQVIIIITIIDLYSALGRNFRDAVLPPDCSYLLIWTWILFCDLKLGNYIRSMTIGVSERCKCSQGKTCSDRVLFGWEG